MTGAAVPRLGSILNLQVQEWLNTEQSFSAPDFLGKVVMVEAFQMLCPGCVGHSLPQAQRAHRLFAGPDFAVVGLHTVFEHHQAQGQTEVLKAFVYENRLTFPIAIDAASPDDPIPLTMRAYGLQGTPSVLLFDRAGRLAFNQFGVVDDLALGFTIATLIAQTNE